MSGWEVLIWIVGNVVSFLFAGFVQILSESQDAASTLESLAKVLALVVGAIWTWQTYVRKRVKFPAAQVEHVITSWHDDGRTFLRVALRMRNTGNVMIPSAEGCTWVQQLTPLPAEINEVIAAGVDPVQKDTTEFPWPIIGERKLNAETRYEIEPGEPDEFHFDFCIDRSVSRVLIYSHVENRTKSGLFGTQKIGWNLSTVYEITDSEKGIRKWLRRNL